MTGIFIPSPVQPKVHKLVRKRLELEEESENESVFAREQAEESQNVKAMWSEIDVCTALIDCLGVWNCHIWAGRWPGVYKY
jgi:hypothetical protein